MVGSLVHWMDGWSTVCIHTNICCRIAPKTLTTNQKKRTRTILYGFVCYYTYRVSATNILNAVAVVCANVCVCFIFLRLTNFIYMWIKWRESFARAEKTLCVRSTRRISSMTIVNTHTQMCARPRRAAHTHTQTYSIIAPKIILVDYFSSLSPFPFRCLFFAQFQWMMKSLCYSFIVVIIILIWWLI